MCGIAGCVSITEGGVNEPNIKNALSLLRHRGPDDEGFLLGTFEEILNLNQFEAKQKICLIHTRLSINDLSTNGRNPLTYKNSSAYVVFNGEIYNFKSLRIQLLNRGYSFSSESDTEVLLVAYLEFGDDFVNLLDGMFALAIWDFRAKEVKLFRDRLGIKPLYYYEGESGFFFASEIKALLALSGLEAAIDEIALAQHLQFQNQLSNRTLFKNVSLLLPGSRLTIRQTGEPLVHKWWRPRIQPDYSLTFDEIKARTIEILKQSVESQLMGDVPIGSYLSGGLDSAIVTALASSTTAGLETYTVGFTTNGVSLEETSFDEVQKGLEAAAHLKLPNLNTRLTPIQFLKDWVPTVLAIEDLRVGPSVQIMSAAALAKTKSTVVLSGAGGDELFGGYPWRYPNSDMDDDAAFHHWYERASRLMTDQKVRRLMKNQSIFQKLEWDAALTSKYTWDHLLADKSIDKALLMDLETFLHGLLLVEDKLSMQHAIEVRVPILSNDLIDFALTIPHNFKVDHLEGKIILREIAHELLPSSFSKAKKQGFTPPMASWFRNELRIPINSFVFTDAKYLPTILNVDEMQEIFKRHLSGEVNNRMLIWSLTSLEIWGRFFILKESAETITDQLTKFVI
jgi:asparagine synthase (glutamine-hydrolysing)